MEPKDTQRRMHWALALFVLTAGIGRVSAQALPWGANQVESISWMANAPQLDYIKTDVEVRHSSYKPAKGPTRNWDDLTLYPAAGITWKNYVYNPYLLNYSLLFDEGYYWQQTENSGNYSRTKQLMLNGNAMVTMLSAKPYAATVTYGHSHSNVQADFFSSQTVDQESWGLLSGYRAGAVPVTLTLEQSRNDRTGDNQDYIIKELKFGVHATNERKNGAMTLLDYQFDRFDSQSNAGSSSYTSENRSHRTLLTDTERFTRSTLSSSLNYNRRENTGSSFSDLNAYSNYNLTVTPQLDNFLNYSLNDNSAHGYTSVTNSILAGLNHRLYESLGSHLDLHGMHSDNDSAGATLRASNVGATVSESYSKRLGDWGHLSINLAGSYDLTDQQSRGGEIIIPDESYTIPATGPMIIRLKLPTDLSITSITKNNVVLDASEWRAITTTDPWQVQFITGGAHSVRSGDAIAITYVVRPNPSGTYSTHNYMAEIALRFWHDQAGIRASYMVTGNKVDSPGFVLQDLKQYQFGADAGGGGFHADASYTHQTSTLYSYKSYAVSESYTLPLSGQSTVGVNCYQQWNDFPVGSGSSPDQSQKLTFYSYMLRYDWHPSGAFNLNAEAGLQQQRGSSQDQNLFAGRIYLNWTFGKLEVHLGFERENRQYVGDDFFRNYAFLRMRRGF